MVGAHVDEPGVGGHVVDPVRDRVPAVLVREAVVTDLHRVPRLRHSRPACAYSPTSSFFFASTLITGCPAARCSLACAAIYRNWASRSGCRWPRSPSRWPGWRTPARAAAARPSAGCTGAPDASARPTSSSRSSSSTAAATPGPPGRVRHQGQQRRHQPRIGPGQPRAARTRPADPAGRRNLTGLQLRDPVRDRLPGRPGRLGHRGDPAVPGRRAAAASTSRRDFSSSTGSTSSSCGPISFTSSAFAPIPASWHATRRKPG